MRFLVDAQLPARLARFLSKVGHEVVHTSDLPDGNRTPDQGIIEFADGQGRIVVTKDRDFRDGHLLARSPQRLLVVATGNIINAALLTLFEAHLDAIIDAFGESDFLELRADVLIVHQRSGDDVPQ